MSSKEELMKQVDLGFQIYEMTKYLTYEQNHMVNMVVEQLKRKDQVLNEVACKEAYATGRPVPVRN